jgi:hypothetical protein
MPSLAHGTRHIAIMQLYQTIYPSRLQDRLHIFSTTLYLSREPTSTTWPAPLIAITRTPCRPIILLDHIPTRRHGILSLLQHTPQRRVPRICQLERLQLSFIPYSRVAAGVKQDVDDGVACGFPVGLVERVYVAHGFVEGCVALQAVDFVDFDAFLVEEEV